MGRRYYVNSAPQQNLQSAITSSETLLTVLSMTGWPQVPFYATLGMGTSSEEVVLVTATTTTTATVTRGQDGSTAVAHSAGETLNQTVVSADLDEANAHVNATTGVHGVIGSVLGSGNVGGAAMLNVGTAAGTVAAGDDSRILGATQKASNLSDLANTTTARTNLGLGAAATQNVGTAAGTVAAGNDSRFAGLPATTQTAAYTLAATDAGTVVELNAAAAVNVTVPPNVFTAGQVVEVTQYGAGQVTLVAGAGVTLPTPGSLKTRVQYSSIFLRFRSATEAVVSGDMA